MSNHFDIWGVVPFGGELKQRPQICNGYPSRDRQGVLQKPFTAESAEQARFFFIILCDLCMLCGKTKPLAHTRKSV